MATLTHRLQVLLDEERYDRLQRLASQYETTVAALVRDALDRAYPSGRVTATAAAERLLGRAPLPDLGDWDSEKRWIEDSMDRTRPS